MLPVSQREARPKRKADAGRASLLPCPLDELPGEDVDVSMCSLSEAASSSRSTVDSLEPDQDWEENRVSAVVEQKLNEDTRTRLGIGQRGPVRKEDKAKYGEEMLLARIFAHPRWPELHTLLQQDQVAAYALLKEMWKVDPVLASRLEDLKDVIVQKLLEPVSGTVQEPSAVVKLIATRHNMVAKALEGGQTRAEQAIDAVGRAHNAFGPAVIDALQTLKRRGDAFEEVVKRKKDA